MLKNASKGKLYLIPTPLSEAQNGFFNTELQELVRRLDVFVVERSKTARQFLKSIGLVRPIAEIELLELNEHTTDAEKHTLIAPLLAGKDVGLMSEAGCPGVADPGAEVVRFAHQNDITVVPLVGPSSILLALMASGLNGQSFCFLGYLTAKRNLLAGELRRLEQQSARARQTQIFIEAPYRNTAIIEAALSTLSPTTLLCVATDLTSPDELIKTMTIADWRLSQVPDLHKRPTVFLILSQ